MTTGGNMSTDLRALLAELREGLISPQQRERIDAALAAPATTREEALREAAAWFELASVPSARSMSLDLVAIHLRRMADDLQAAAPAASEPPAQGRPCTCHPDDRTDPCAQKYAASECKVASPTKPAEPDSPAVEGAWNAFNRAIGDGPDVPYPGMATAFEKHFGQSFADKDWRSEASTWAAAWKFATDRAAPTAPPAQPAAEPVAPDDYSSFANLAMSVTLLKVIHAAIGPLAAPQDQSAEIERLKRSRADGWDAADEVRESLLDTIAEAVRLMDHESHMQAFAILRDALSDRAPTAWSCSSEAIGGRKCDKWCGDEEKCLAAFTNWKARALAAESAPEPAAQEPVAPDDYSSFANLAMSVKRLVHQYRSLDPHDPLSDSVMKFLRECGGMGSPLRVAPPSHDALAQPGPVTREEAIDMALRVGFERIEVKDSDTAQGWYFVYSGDSNAIECLIDLARGSGK
jgi:hypothetical protein